MRLTRRSALVGGGLAALGTGLAACGSSGSSSAGSGGSDGGGGASGTITIGYVPSWSDGLSMAHLADNRLTAMGYTVEHQHVADAGVLWAGMGGGDVDLFASAWPEVTHAAYYAEYEDSVEDLGEFYQNARLNLSVPEYVDIDAIDQLAGQADRFGGRIVGIEPGAGLTAAAQDDVIPGYGLDGDYELVLSSTNAMLTELGSAIDAQEDIVVTLWTPFWANSTYPVKALEDPEGLFGEPEALHIIGRGGFRSDFPEAADYLSRIELDDAQYNQLEDLVVNEYGEGQEAEAVEAWIEENPGVLPEV